MSVRPQSKHVNPLLGVYFGIFGAGLVGILVLLLILEQLGTPLASLRALLTIGSLGLYAAIGAAAYATTPAAFLTSERRVPSFFAGIGLAMAGLGGTGLVAFSGAIFLAGFDALCLPLGVIAGLVAMVILVTPYLRKFGAPTLPGYLGLRFESATVRLVAASIAATPLILLLMAELKVALLAAAWLVDLPERWAMALIVASLVATLAPGGVRSLSWSGAAQSMAVLLAILVPASIVAIMVTYLPLGQLSHGPVLRALGRTELLQGLPAVVAAPLAFELPGQALQPIAGRFATPFGSVGPLAFVLAALTVMTGIAGSPAHLGRTGTTPNVYEARKSIGWAVLIVGVTIMTLSGMAVFLRDVLMNQLAGATPDKLPQSIKALMEMKLADVDTRTAQIPATGFLFRRDGVLIGLPVAMGLPMAIVMLTAAGILAAALAGAATSLCQLGLIVAEDVVGAGQAGGTVQAGQRTTSMRLLTARLAIAAVAVAAGFASVAIKGDPLDLMIWALALSGSSLFPVLLLSIWWKRINTLGALAGLAAGFVTGLACLVADELGAVGLPGVLAPMLGAPAAIAAAIGASLLTHTPGRHQLEMVRDLRIPGGETIWDREARLAAQRSARQA